MRILITGTSGYIGGMLVDRFSEDPKVSRIFAIDMTDPLPDALRENAKTSFLKYNLGDTGWEEKVLAHGVPDVAIHCAYVIREGYGKKREWQIKSNITAAERVFNFVFKNKIPKLIHFSTVASYGACHANSTGYQFKETDPFREENYLYGVDKKIIEEKLKNLYEKIKPDTQVLIARPCAITGPRGQFTFKRFGLLRVVKFGLPMVPVTGPDSARQFIHEDDAWEAVKLMVSSPRFAGEAGGGYEVFNLAPVDFLLLKDMAREIGKIYVRVPMWLGRLTFGAIWHLSRGRIPTVPAGINSYTYPIIADGSKLTRFGFQYKYSAKEALKADRGHYALDKNNRGAKMTL